MNKRRRYKAKRRRLLRKQHLRRISLFFDLNLLPITFPISKEFVWDKYEHNVQD